MIIREKEVTLKNGKKVIIKSPEKGDAKKLIEHLYRTSEETDFLSRYPEEIAITEEEEEIFIKRFCEDENEFMLAAYMDGELIGNAGVQVLRNHVKYRHRGCFGISIQKKAWGLGLGTIMMKEVLDHVRKTEFVQIELGVFSDNMRAQHLYEKMGFERTGIQPRAYKLKDGTYRDEIQMVYRIE